MPTKPETLPETVAILLCGLLLAGVLFGVGLLFGPRRRHRGLWLQREPPRREP